MYFFVYNSINEVNGEMETSEGIPQTKIIYGNVIE